MTLYFVGHFKEFRGNIRLIFNSLNAGQNDPQLSHDESQWLSIGIYLTFLLNQNDSYFSGLFKEFTTTSKIFNSRNAGQNDSFYWVRLTENFVNTVRMELVADAFTSNLVYFY